MRVRIYHLLIIGIFALSSCSSESTAQTNRPASQNVNAPSSSTTNTFDAGTTTGNTTVIDASTTTTQTQKTLVVTLKWTRRVVGPIVCDVPYSPPTDDSIQLCSATKTLTVDQFKKIVMSFGPYGCTASETTNLGQIECDTCTSYAQYGCNFKHFNQVYCDPLPNGVSDNSCTWNTVSL